MKQTQQLRKDLEVFEQDPVNTQLSTIGQITTTITQLSRILQEYDDFISKQTLNENSKLKNETRLLNFQNELSESKIKFQSLKKQREEDLAQISKNSLFNNTSTAVSDNPYESNTVVNRHANIAAQQQSGLSMQEGLYKEQSILQRGDEQLDAILEMGQQAFTDLVEQNEIIKKTQQKMVQSLETLGVSRETIRKIEKKAFEDKWIFYIGAILTLYFFYLILKYLR
ncbi:hypothetical protein B5S33_g4989 [[Candida] boidinii]|mgnify:CR=1 FL=1|nr:hypothetical protein B5S30_g4557 [[Candida] boidinii]OWB86303.1 hypothetical protein B5S33_g4989 [[Candida] boidinii]